MARGRPLGSKNKPKFPQFINLNPKKLVRPDRDGVPFASKEKDIAINYMNQKFKEKALISLNNRTGITLGGTRAHILAKNYKTNLELTTIYSYDLNKIPTRSEEVRGEIIIGLMEKMANGEDIGFIDLDITVCMGPKFLDQIIRMLLMSNGNFVLRLNTCFKRGAPYRIKEKNHALLRKFLKAYFEYNEKNDDRVQYTGYSTWNYMKMDFHQMYIGPRIVGNIATQAIKDINIYIQKQIHPLSNVKNHIPRKFCDTKGIKVCKPIQIPHQPRMDQEEINILNCYTSTPPAIINFESKLNNV